MSTGQKIIDGLKDAVAGNFARVVIEGQTWARIDPPPAGYRTIPIQRLEALMAAKKAGHELARSADTAELLLRETHPGKAASLRLRVTAWIEAEAAVIDLEDKP